MEGIPEEVDPSPTYVWKMRRDDGGGMHAIRLWLEGVPDGEKVALIGMTGIHVVQKIDGRWEPPLPKPWATPELQPTVVPNPTFDDFLKWCRIAGNDGPREYEWPPM